MSIIDKFIKSGLSLANARVLLQVIEAYGYTFSVSYMKIGIKLGVSNECVRKHFKALEELGFISIEHSSTKRLVCHINKEKVNELL